MKVKTSELIGASLDWAVASIEALPKDRLHFFYGKPAIDRECLGRIDTLRCEFSTNWAQGGPILEREGISLLHLFVTDDPFRWTAKQKPTIKNVKPDSVYGPTPLVAAMRCYVAMRLGDEIDIPEELLK